MKAVDTSEHNCSHSLRLYPHLTLGVGRRSVRREQAFILTRSDLLNLRQFFWIPSSYLTGFPDFSRSIGEANGDAYKNHEMDFSLSIAGCNVFSVAGQCLLVGYRSLLRHVPGLSPLFECD